MTYYNTTDFNNDNYSYSDEDSSIASSTTKKIIKKTYEMKKLDPGFFTVKRLIMNEKTNKMRKTKIELYRSSGMSDRKIRNAVTGFYENLRVGRFESDLLFKVILATGETGSNPDQLYFDSPEQYEHHFNVIVPNSVKQTWTEKYNNEVENQKVRKSNKYNSSR
jgi:hypothetical protein